MDIFVVEDSVAIRRLLVRRLDVMPGVRVVGEAVGEQQACALIQWTQPDVVLLDLSLASGSGLGVLTRLRSAGSKVRVEVLTSQDAEAYRRVCLQAGADAFYDKGTGLGLLFEDLGRRVAAQPGGREGQPTAQLRDGLTGLLDKITLPAPGAPTRPADPEEVDLVVYMLRLIGLGDLPVDAADEIARQVTARLRAAGTADDGMTRSTPDQFAVLLSRPHDAEAAAVHARRLGVLMAQPFHLEGRACRFAIEIGMALFPVAAHTPGGVLTLSEASGFGAL
jgi:CheY-like chemotaxis protein